MMRANHVRLSVALFSAAALSTTIGHAAGFAVAEQSVSGLGYGYAGAAAIAEDNSTVWFNPAGLTYLSSAPQVSGGVHMIIAEAELRNTGSLTLDPTGAQGTPYVPTQGRDATFDDPAFVPNFFYSHPVSDRLVLGLAVNAPFGLRTDYPQDWVGRYFAWETDLVTINVNPGFGYRISDTLSFGAGVSVMHADAVLSNAIDFGLVALANVGPATLGPALTGDIAMNRGRTAYDGGLELEGDDYGYGFNFGFLWEPRNGTRVGLHYRSEVDLNLEGDANFTLPNTLQPFLGAAFADQGGQVDLTLPSSLSLSLFHELTRTIALLADVTWTDWSQFQELRIEYENPSPPTSVVPENWNDTMRYSVGVRYLMDERIALRAGLVYDEAAVPGPRYRSPRIPDAERAWTAIGAQFQVSGGFAIDVAYAHVFVDDARTENDTHTAGQQLIGDSEAAVNIFSVGGLYSF